MILSKGSLRERLASLVRATWAPEGKKNVEREIVRWLDPSASVHVRETNVQGEADLAIELPASGDEFAELWLPTGLFQILADDRNVDGILLQLREESLVAHVFECKRRVRPDKWAKALAQMNATLVKLCALAGALGVPIVGVTFYTVYREQFLDNEALQNPIQAELTIGEGADDTEATLDAGRRKQSTWTTGAIFLESFEGTFRHERVPVDKETGRGTLRLKA